MSPIYTFFFYTAIISGLIPLLLIFIKNSKFNKFKNPILPYIVLVFIASLYEYFGSYILEINTVAWFMIYKVGAFGTLSYYFYHLLNKKFKVIFIAFTILFTVIFFINLPKVSNETFLNINGFYDDLIKMLQTSVEHGFSQARFVDTLIVSDNIHDILAAFQKYQPAVPKWTSRNEIQA